MDRQEFVKELPMMESFYVIYSRLTRLPYMVCNAETFDDEVTMYSDQTMADDAVRSLEAQGIPTYVVKCENKDFLRAFSEFYAYGINMLRFFTPEDEYAIPIGEIAKQKTYDDLPENQRPLDNSSLQISMIYYMQELRKEKEKPDPMKYRDMEEEMFANIMRAKFYLPFRDQVIDGVTKQQLNILKMKTGAMLVGVFTDPIEFTKFLTSQPGYDPNAEIKASILTFEALMNVPVPPELTGYVINPAGINLPIPKDYAKKLVADFKNREA